MAGADRVRRIYDRVAATYDETTRWAVVEHLRGAVLGQALGRVLELGVGTGATFAHYTGQVSHLTAVDISAAMLARARDKAAGLPCPVEFQRLDYQRLPFPDVTFDTVVSSLALCGIPDPAGLFAEIRRVLRPGGRLLAVEHIRPPNPLLGLLADLGSPVNNHFVGCYLNRRTPDLLRAAGFEVTIVERRLLRAVVALIAVPRPA